MSSAPERQLSDQAYIVTHTVGPSHEGTRLDQFLKERYAKRSRNQIQTAIESGVVVLERARITSAPVGKLRPSSPLLNGDRVLVVSERKPEPEVDLDYKILFEDDVLFVIDKPPNLPVHPAGRFFFNTLLTHLRTSPETGNRGHDYYLAHRIDKETSGILILSKTPASCTHLTEQFSSRQTRKRYLALAHGHPAQKTFSVDAPMRRAQTSSIDVRMEIASVTDGGLPALTDFEVLSTHTIRVPQTGEMRPVSVIQCAPKTGRQHQIRVHLDHVGHAIVGDKLYGMPEELAYAYYEHKILSDDALARLILPRHALHAAGIEFTHPTTGKHLTIESPLPRDLAALLT